MQVIDQSHTDLRKAAGTNALEDVLRIQKSGTVPDVEISKLADSAKANSLFTTWIKYFDRSKLRRTLTGTIQIGGDDEHRWRDVPNNDTRCWEPRAINCCSPGHRIRIVVQCPTVAKSLLLLFIRMRLFVWFAMHEQAVLHPHVMVCLTASPASESIRVRSSPSPALLPCSRLRWSCRVFASVGYIVAPWITSLGPSDLLHWVDSCHGLSRDFEPGRTRSRFLLHVIPRYRVRMHGAEAKSCVSSVHGLSRVSVSSSKSRNSNSRYRRKRALSTFLSANKTETLFSRACSSHLWRFWFQLNFTYFVRVSFRTTRKRTRLSFHK